ncbi:prenyltransferase [Acetobacterium malicum]|uniref:Prenyltransferase n=1 Tax=Acetobacterium malicum TaxID=52692 RepID=A0ABR6Z171_9FIRM|nr:prenyltransferase [Acetobacterium malicum]MBC3901263.1 prenyltransferase [Acetobacterium malicum]
MIKDNKNLTDFDQILATRYDNGADFWTTPDGRLGIEKPISTLTALMIISELDVPRDHEALQGAAELVLGAIRADGRVRIAPKGAIHPCHTAHAVTGLCRNGYASHPQVQAALDYLLSDRYEDGGWRCKKFIFGHGPETEASNPGVTLLALDAFRLAGLDAVTPKVPNLDRAVETLLDHWTVKIPVGPCHYGIGNLFMQVEYPFLRYNLFYYVYVLSFYEKARKDIRFIEAFAALKQKLDDQGHMIVERPNRKLSKLSICQKGKPSAAATARYLEITKNLELD